MGLFSDIKKAQAISADTVIPTAAPRIDTLVADPMGEPRHRTDYAGTVWYGGRPEIIGRQPLPGADAEITAPFWLPDSHAYEPELAETVQIQASAAVQGGNATSTGGNFQILEVAAALGEDPQGEGGSFLFVAVSAVATLPFGVAYRMTVVSPPEALRRAA